MACAIQVSGDAGDFYGSAFPLHRPCIIAPGRARDLPAAAAGVGW